MRGSAVLNQGSKRDPLKGAALARMALERSGLSPDSSFFKELLEDLSLSEEEVLRYIGEHEEELSKILESRGASQPGE